MEDLGMDKRGKDNKIIMQCKKQNNPPKEQTFSLKTYEMKNHLMKGMTENMKRKQLMKRTHQLRTKHRTINKSQVPAQWSRNGVQPTKVDPDFECIRGLFAEILILRLGKIHLVLSRTICVAYHNILN